MNEEEIRGKLLLPFLTDLAFDLSEISLEESFVIRLGKTKHTIRGRSDILCKRNGKNLFIIELKNDSLVISQNDIDQGISYARALIDNIAPFVIITNGITTKIFDSITKQDITGKKISDQSSFFKNDYILSTDEDLRIRYEALKNFVSISPGNLKIFCEQQVRERMGQIIGSITSPYAKFVRELFVQRNDLQIAFESFIISRESTFGLIGSAGVGKTCAICSLALRSLDENFVFFYNAAIIQSPLECIAQDLSVTFSNRSESDIVLKKLDEIGRLANKMVLIFIDAIDENTNPNISIELSEIALIAKNLDKVKIIITCKSNIWENIIKIKNKPTHLYEELSKHHGTINTNCITPGFLLNDFSEEELKKIVPLYQKAFAFKGEISSNLINELKNGFFLKIFSEVYQNKEVPKEISDQELIKKYLKQSLDETGIGFISGLRTLAAIGKVMLNYSYTFWEANRDEGLDINYFHKKLNLSLEGNIPEDLFTRNILIKSNSEDSYNISFYYSKIRDYIICFHSCHLDKLSDQEFYDVLLDFYQNHIGKSSLDFYLRSAKYAHLQVVIRFKKDKALSYVEHYNSYLENNFKKFKEKFDPNTKNDIGIVLSEDLIQDNGYGLIPLNSGYENKIIFENLGRSSSSGYEMIWEKGVKKLYVSQSLQFVADQNLAVKKNVFSQLEELLKKGKFSSYNSEILLKEQISIILYFYYKKLDYNFNVMDCHMPRFNCIYPIDLQDLKYRINKFKLNEFYKYEPIDQILKAELIEKALSKNEKIPEYNIGGEVPPFEELGKIVELLLMNGYSEIREHYLPLPDVSIAETRILLAENVYNNFRHIRMLQFSESQARIYVTTFFKHLDTCYNEFIEYCFPSFKDQLPFYSGGPHEYFFYMKDSEVLKRGTFGYRDSRTGQSEIYFKDSNSRDEAFQKEGLESLRGFSLDLILKVQSYTHGPVSTVDGINIPKVDEYCVLRNWIYNFLTEDMKLIFKEFKE